MADDRSINPKIPLINDSNKRHSHGFMSILSLLVNYLQSDMAKRPRSFRIGVCSVFIVVTFLSLLLSLILIGTVIYLKVAENEVGEADIILIPTPAANDTRTLNTTNVDSNNLQNSYRLINYREMEPYLEQVDTLSGYAPRWTLKAEVYNPDDPEEAKFNTSSYIIIADTKLERDIGLGRSFSKVVLGYGEAFATSSILTVLGITASQGQRLIIHFDFLSSLADAGIISDNSTRADIATQLLESFGLLNNTDTNYTINPNDVLGNTNPDLNVTGLPNITVSSNTTNQILIDAVANLTVIDIPFTVVESIESPEGKWTAALGNVVLVDAKYIKDEIVSTVKGALTQSLSVLNNQTTVDNLINSLESIDIFEYTLYVNIIVKDRIDIYTNDVNHMKISFTHITNQIYNKLGYGHPTEPQLLLAQNMEGIQIMKAFLDNVFMSVIVFLVILSFILIYSLMLGNVEEKTYEYGMLRSLGMKYKTLTEYLLLQCSSFSFPGLVMGLFLSFLLNILGAYAIGRYTALNVSIILHPYAWMTGILIGTLLPLFSVYVPIKRALSATLRDSLDLYHHVITSLTVTILKLEKMGLSPPLLAVSFVLIFMGFLTYYLVPYAFLMQKYEVFLFLLNIILLFMIVGLTFLVHLLQPYLEQLNATIVLYLSYYDRRLGPLVKKNLVGHSSRNWKSSLMVSMSLSFIIFAGVSFNLEGSITTKLLYNSFGGDLYIYQPTSKDTGLAEGDIRNWLDNIYGKNHSDNIKGYTFASGPLDNLPDIGSTAISNICGDPSQSTNIIGVEEHYLDAIYTEYYIPTEKDSDVDFPDISENQPDLIYGLYTDEGLVSYNGDWDYYGITSEKLHTTYKEPSSNLPIKAVIAEGMRDPMSMNTDTAIRFKVTNHDTDVDSLFRGRVRGMATKIPGFYFSSYSYIAYSSTTFVSMDDYKTMVDAVYNGNWPSVLTAGQPEGTTLNIPKYYLIVKLKSGLVKADRDVVANGIRTFFTNDETTLINVGDLVEVANQTVMIMQAFFIVTGIVALVLAFFLLWTNFSANVRENSWEYGVLRSLGLTGKECTRLYIYESTLLTFSAVVLGTTVGISIAVLLSAQFNLFTEMPLDIEFPFAMFFIMVFIALLAAVGGSYYPAKDIEKFEISRIVRGINL
ncbi:unnamed protein product [Blepharisma stoltei]|uniref:ABC3 transporter permease C-terminal domain-containing protein n=1 Tax=Blepharisma stoltei TaxID=1481888 RepID=A0AAU9JBI4_9CILI|nr:unnamed protein product [Blepharisma stoltei]